MQPAPNKMRVYPSDGTRKEIDGFVDNPPAPTLTFPHDGQWPHTKTSRERFLGEGGKKRVYVAYDGSLDREVALAVIKSEGLDEESKARVTCEVRAMYS